MSDGSASAGGKSPLRPVDVSPKKKPAEESSAHLLGEMRHSPEMIKELFRTGKYPYKNKIRSPSTRSKRPSCRSSFSRSRTGSSRLVRRLLSSARVAMRPARVARSSAIWNISIRAQRELLLWRSPLSMSLVSGTSSATSSTCPPRAKWCSLIAPGTTGPVLNA